MPELRERLSAYVDGIALADTHEHIPPEAERYATPQDLFSWFPHYASSDLMSAGMPVPVLEEVRNPYLPLEERWRKFAPYWEATRNTAYCKALLLAARDLHGVADINADSYQDLSAKITATCKPGWYRHVLRERAGIAVSINDTDYISPTNRGDLDLFAPARRLDDFICVRSRADLRQIERTFDVAIHSLDDLVHAMGLAVERAIAAGYVNIKTAMAYRRVIRYDKVTHAEAERVFNSMPNYLDELRDRVYPGIALSMAEAKPLQDYLMHQSIRLAAEYRLPMQIHTGLQEGTGNVLAHSNPLLLSNLFSEYPEVKFDIFHAGYPWTSEVAVLGKNFPNVYVDTCWVAVISPAVARRTLHEWLETVPGNKILAFGGDYRFVEGAYAHAVMARRAVAQVLAEKVEEGYFAEEEALSLARRILHDNAWGLFKLAERKRPDLA
ncbi:MAG: amidohydrolase family protein [Chloroflexota bacterium]